MSLRHIDEQAALELNGAQPYQIPQFEVGQMVKLNDPLSFYNGSHFIIDDVAAYRHCVVYTIRRYGNDGSNVSTAVRENKLERA